MGYCFTEVDKSSSQIFLKEIIGEVEYTGECLPCLRWGLPFQALKQRTKNQNGNVKYHIQNKRTHDNSHSNRYEVISHYDFDLHFPDY